MQHLSTQAITSMRISLQSIYFKSISSLLLLMLCLVCIFTASANGQGLNADYYTGRNFNTYERSESNVSISADWGREGPFEGGPVDNFSVRWLGQISAPMSGVYQFRADYDDGYRLWVGDQLIINAWSGGPAVLIGEVSLTAARLTPIVVEFFEQGGIARSLLSWRLKDTNAEFVEIPASALHLVGPNDGPPRVGLSVRDARGLEGNDPARFTVYRLGGLDQDVTVQLVYSGDAEEGLDFVNPPREVTIAAGYQARDFDINRSNDEVARGPKSLEVSIVYSEDYILLNQSEITLTLLDDERDLSGMELYTVAGQISGLQSAAPVVVKLSGSETYLVQQVGNGPFSFPPLTSGDFQLSAWIDEDRDGVLSEGETLAELRSPDAEPASELNISIPPHQLAVDIVFSVEEPQLETAGQEVAGMETEEQPDDAGEVMIEGNAGRDDASDEEAEAINAGDTAGEEAEPSDPADSGCTQDHSSHHLPLPMILVALLMSAISVKRSAI